MKCLLTVSRQSCNDIINSICVSWGKYFTSIAEYIPLVIIYNIYNVRLDKLRNIRDQVCHETLWMNRHLQTPKVNRSHTEYIIIILSVEMWVTSLYIYIIERGLLCKKKGKKPFFLYIFHSINWKPENKSEIKLCEFAFPKS